MQTDDWLEALGNAYIRFWICPVDGHSDIHIGPWQAVDTDGAAR